MTMETTVRYLTDRAGCQVVPLSIEGRSVLAAFEPNLDEHHRRRAVGITAVRSRRLLHALWALPRELPWPASALDPDDLSTLVAEGAGAVELGDQVVRRYQPAGQVRAVGVRSKWLGDSVQRVGMMPPIFVRYAIATSRHDSDERAASVAAELGVGVATDEPSGVTVHSEPAAAQTGVPGVYRWWLSEAAYAAWLQLNVH